MAAGALFLSSVTVPAQTNTPTEPRLLTNFTEMWTWSGPQAQQYQHIRAEAVITFYDVDWSVAFGISNGKTTYLPIANSKQLLKAGQHILLDGYVIPASHFFAWDRTQIKVLEENVPLPVTAVTSLKTNALQIDGTLVSVDGLVDQLNSVDATHLRLTFLINGESATVNVHLHSTNQTVTFKQADFLRIEGLYVPTFDGESNVSAMTLWVDGAEKLQKIGSIATDPRFAIPATSADHLGVTSELIRVAGVVRSYEPGKFVTIWDDTGEITAQSAQTQPLRPGDHIEAIGHDDDAGLPHYLRSALYRMADTNKLAAAAQSQTNAPAVADSQTTATAPPLLLTNFTQMWSWSGPQAQQYQHIRTEAVITFYDMEWTVAFGINGGKSTYLPIAHSKLPLKAGQHILLDGYVIPARELFAWDRTQIKVLEENVPLPVTAVTSLRTNAPQIGGTLVSVDGLIDQFNPVDSTHVRFAFLVNGESATVTIHLHTTNQPVAFRQGDFVRVEGLYVPTFDRDGNVNVMDLWVDGAGKVQKIGSIDEDPRFAIPFTSADQLGNTSELIRVAGAVRSYEPGRWVTIWDDTGEITVQSAQTQPLRPGDHIEAVGHDYDVGLRHYLRSALYRMADTNKLAADLGTSPNPAIRLAARIQSLSPAEVSRHPPVNLRAILMWSDSAAPFIYVEDASGGVRVDNPKWADTNLSDGTILIVRGEVTAGAYVPVVTNAVLTRSGWVAPEAPEPITLDQALSGAAEGRYVEMRAYVRSASVTNGLIHLRLSTSRGEFQACTPGTWAPPAWLGAVVRIRGICTATSNDRHQLTGIELWVPSPDYVLIEEKAPDDLFATPSRSLGDLRRFNSQNDLNQRVRTVGTVVLQSPGRYLYVQDGKDSVFALSQQNDVLHAGDRVEVVGFPGNQGRRFLLREAAFRRITNGVEPEPVPLPDRHVADPEWEGLLATGSGTLLDAVQKDGEARLLIQSAGYTFDARFDSQDMMSAAKVKDLPLNSKVAVTGVYEVQSDEYGHPASFSLHLRSWDDARLLATPPWWTLSRMLTLLLVVVVGTLLAVGWALNISYKNSLLHRAQDELKLVNSQLEDRVILRTHELSEQVKVKEQALSELAQTQQRLMHASRQAGMAEVATGVLHNVGNVLNSVNVSASCLRDRVKQLRVEYVGQTASLLKQEDDHLASFLTNDPRGRSVPAYLTKLGENLMREKVELTNEIESLSKNVEHINAIVSMQQNNAKFGGVLESLEVRTLVEDAIQINSAAYDRHAIDLLADFQPVPAVLVDRHKVMQILINLLGNAKHALESRSSDKRVTVRVFSPNPDCVRVTVADNGMGIAHENLDRIFSQGFTTRKAGHGFGLHNGALAAKELGGALNVQSDGPGLGATFTLEFPVRPVNPKHTAEIVTTAK